ncbi:MAG: glycosidase, partial [Steroidobacteraceae bacterium]
MTLNSRAGRPSSGTFLTRQSLSLRPNPARVVVRPFKPAAEPRELAPTDKSRANHVVARILGLDPKAADRQLAEVLENFQGRHRNLLATFEARASDMEDALSAHGPFTQTQHQLIGAYFMHEYSFEAAALFNPSIVAHPEQSGVPAGERRFILCLRAVGEGHVSSLTFRSGFIAADGSVKVERAAPLASLPTLQPRGAGAPADCIDVVFKAEEELSERVIFPITAA